MGDMRAGVESRNRRSARIGEKIQHAQRSALFSDYLGGHIPVDCLLRENARMLEAHGFDHKREIAVFYLPRIGNLSSDIPLSAARR